MKVQRRIKRTTKQYIIVAVICIIIIGGAAIFTSVTITGQIREEYKALLLKAETELEANKKYAFVASSDITQGEIISLDNVEIKQVFTSTPEASFLTEEELGKTALITIPSGAQILNTMVTVNLNASEMREKEFEVINISSNILNNDIIDVRIFFPNGEDYIILSKKTMKGIELGTGSCLLWLNEEELLRMSSAIVDAYLYKGAKIYTTKYIEPNLQEASYTTYEPSVSTLLLIQDNPNIIDTAVTELSKQVRKAMENRLAASMSIDVQNIEWELTPNNSEIDGGISSVQETEDNATFQEELNDREAELDYGP